MPPYAIYPTDESDSINSAQSGEKRSRKSVRFAVENHVRAIEHWSDFSVDRSTIWFTTGEISQIAERDRIIVEFMRQQRFHETDEHSGRGLSTDSVRDRKIRQMAASIVIAEQFRQLANGRIKPEELADISRKISKDHVEIALKRAENDFTASFQSILVSLPQQMETPITSQGDQCLSKDVSETVGRISSEISVASSQSKSYKSNETKVLLRPQLSPRRKDDVPVYSDSNVEYATMSERRNVETRDSSSIGKESQWVSCGEWVGRQQSSIDSPPPPPASTSTRWSTGLWNGAIEILQSTAWVSCGTWGDLE